MINLNDKVKVLFPDLYTKQGNLVKRIPHKYICPNCKNEFSKTQEVKFSWISFGSKTCNKCDSKGKESFKYNVWKRLTNGEIIIEDFIINAVNERGSIVKDELEQLVEEEFGDLAKGQFSYEGIKGLSTLVYYGYLVVDAEKRDNKGIIVYSIGDKKDLENRFELIS